MKNYTKILSKTLLFKGMKEEEIERFIFFLNPAKRIYKKGDFIISAGSPVEDIALVLLGNIHIIKEDIEGNRSIIGMVKQSGMFAEAMACAHVKHSPVSVLAISDCEVLFINFDKVLNLRKTQNAPTDRLIRNLITLIAQKNIFLNNKLEHISKRSIRGKLLSYFNELSIQNDGRAFTLPFTKAALADYLFIDRSAMTRELAKMRTQKLISFKGRTFKITKQANF